MYKYELHLATSDFAVGDRAGITAEEAVEKYIEAGYDGVVLTNQWGYKIYNEYEPLEAAEGFLSAYEKFKSAAGKDLRVFMGAEITMARCTNDYLFYGIDEDFINNFDPHSVYIDPMYEMFAYFHKRSDVLIYQAHPFLPWGRNVQTEYLEVPNIRPHEYCIDGLQVYNGSKADRCNNEIAFDWALHYNAGMISGSDIFDKNGTIDGGIVTEQPIENNEQLVSVLKNREYKLICGGETVNV